MCIQLDDAELQDEPLQIRLMDYDTYSANDAIGKVNICLNPLLLPSFDMTGQVIRSGKGIVHITRRSCCTIYLTKC